MTEVGERGGRILLVEDDEDCRFSLAALLEADGHLVTAVGARADARACLTRADYALAIVDVRLSDGSGLDLIPEIRAAHRAVKVLLMTGSHDDGTFASADEVILKGIDPEKILATIDRMISSRVGDRG